MASILVVEDERVVAWNIQEALELMGHSVLASVSSGEMAVQVAVANHPDLVLMDIRLAGTMDGIEAARQILSQASLPIVYLTAHTDDLTLKRAIASSPYGYLLKPFNSLELQTTIEVALRRHWLEQQLEASEERYRQIVETAQEGIWVTDSNHSTSFVNLKMADMLGYTMGEMVGQPIFHFMDEDTQTLARPFFDQRHREIIDRRDFKLRRKDGSDLWVLVSSNPIFDQAGQYLGALAMVTDITERKQAEDLLHRREQSFRALVENSPDMVIRWDRNLRYLYVNPTLEQVTHISAATFIGRSNQAVGLPPALVKLWDRVLQDVLETAREKTIEFEFPNGDSNRFYQARMVPELSQTGEVSSVLAVIRDITSHRQAEEALRQQAERERLLSAVSQRIRNSLNLEEILNTTVAEVRQCLQVDRVIIYRFNADLSGTVTVESVLPPWKSILDSTIVDPCFRENYAQAYRWGHRQVIPDIYVANLTPCYQEMLEQLQVRANLAVPIVSGDELWGLLVTHSCGAPRPWQEWEVNLLAQLATQVGIAIQQSALYGQVQQLNTTLERQVEERTAQLQRALEFEALLKRITDRVRDSLDETHILQTAVQELGQGLGVLCCDTALYNSDHTAATITHEYNPSLPSALGTNFSTTTNSLQPEIYHHHLLQGQPCHFCFCISDSVRNCKEPTTILACPILDDQGILGDIWLFKPARDYFDDQEIRLVRQVANQCAIAIRQAHLYRSAQTQVEELARLNHLKDDFLNTVSHELRTPIASVKMAAQLLEVKLRATGILEQDPEGIARYLRILQDECDREIHLVNDLLDLSRLESNTEPISLLPLSLQMWLPHLIEPFVERTQAHQQILQVTVPDDLPTLVTDPSALSRILLELLNNACKYTPAGELIRVEAEASPQGIKIEFTNTGVEISESERARIFEKFYRVPNADPYRYGGTGLGLALVKKIMERLGGTIEVSSAPNQTTFTLLLPHHSN